MKAMGRRLKQIGYGFFYVIVSCVLSICCYLLFFTKYSTCFDGIQNQQELGIDCGGSCIDCELKVAKIDISQVYILSAGKYKSTLVFAITNTAKKYGVYRFDYTLDVFSQFETKLAVFQGVSSLLPGETKYLVVPGISLDSRDIKRATCTTTNVEWKEKDALLGFSLSSEALKTQVFVDDIEVSGIVKNDGATASGKIKLTGLLFGSDGTLLAASTTIVDEISAYNTMSFTIFFPKLTEIVQRLDYSKTQIFYEIERL
ncbi:MAG: hypothetical protein V1652_02145 [bacterium]